MKSTHPSLVLLAVLAFLAPVIGGYVVVEHLPLGGSVADLLGSLAAPEGTPIAHFLLILLAVAAMSGWLMKSRVVQLPAPKLSALILMFFGLLCLSTLTSSYKIVTLTSLVEWLGYALVFFATVAIAGRRHGPVILMAALFAGCVALSLIGLVEYSTMKAVNPSWRIFGGWINPNALAGMLLIGLFVGVGLALHMDGLSKLGATVGVSAVAFALLLTQSRGALLAALVAGLVLLVLIVGGRVVKPVKLLGPAIALAIAVALTAVLARQTPAQTAPATQLMDRVQSAAATQEQSVGFRINLWRSSLELMRMNPAGYGLGSFRYESSRPGLVPQTHFAHQTFLQLGAEASPFAPILLLAFGGLWLYENLKGLRKLESGQNILRVAIVAAVLASVGHSLIDSDLYYFGIGVSFFMLLGLGMLLAADGVAPELMPKGGRGLGLASLAILLSLASYVMYIGFLKARIAMERLDGRPDEFRALTRSLTSIAPMDGEAWFLAAQAAQSPEERSTYLSRAAELLPAPRHFRVSASARAEQGDVPGALGELTRLFQRDRHNLPGRLLKLRILVEAGSTEEANQAARDLIEIEETPYYRVRAVPELVPTETLSARLFLARQTQDPRERIDLLEPARVPYLQLAERTVPLAKQGSAPLAPQQLEDALTEGIEAMKLLEAAYREAGDLPAAALALDAGDALSEALESLSK